ncbi:Voltage-dependent P/Q-type calcium channel subunit alpha-1A, partial [Ophiophagus hannah]
MEGKKEGKREGKERRKEEGRRKRQEWGEIQSGSNPEGGGSKVMREGPTDGGDRKCGEKNGIPLLQTPMIGRSHKYTRVWTHTLRKENPGKIPGGHAYTPTRLFKYTRWFLGAYINPRVSN